MEFVSPIKNNDDIQAMKDYLREWNEMYYMLFITGLNTGLRVGDILTLKVKDVQGWHIKLRERKTGKHNKTDDKRTQERNEKICRRQTISSFLIQE